MNDHSRGKKEKTCLKNRSMDMAEDLQLSDRDSEATSMDIDWNTATAFRITDDDPLLIDEISERMDYLRPSTSGVQSSSNGRDREHEGDSTRSIDNEVTEFQKRMDALSKMERKTAQVFIDQGIPNEYKWPIEAESRDDVNIRKKINSCIYKRNKRLFQNYCKSKT